MKNFSQIIINLIYFLISGIGSLIILAIMLHIAIFFSSEEKIIKIIRKRKPKVIDIILEPVKKFINELINLFINKKYVEIEKNNDFDNKIKFYLEENEKIEKNIFVLSLSEGIVKTLIFINDDYLYETAMNYLINYLNELQALKQDKNFYDNIKNEYVKLENGYRDIINTPNNQNEQLMMCMRKQINQSYFDYLLNEKNKLIDLKNNNNNRIIDLLKKELYERKIN